MGRKLAAILAADVVGYSKLMAEDELATLARLKEHRSEVFDPNISQYHGRVIKLMGDGTLVEFASVVDAVECAVAIQSALAEGGGAIQLRIGINLGDVIIDGDDVYGEGVNVAARLETQAKPGGVCISSIVHESLGSRVDVQFEDAGKCKLKNLPEPLQIWHWMPKVDGKAVVQTATERARGDKPSIAVLPFDNMSGDPEQEYFSDGIAEDVITELSRFHALSVIARNSSFRYKGRSANIQDVGTELSVKYILEGSVRKAGNRVRVTAQLIEATNGHHIWADRFDGDLADIFAVQDEIAERIVASVAPGVLAAEMKEAKRKDVSTLDAWDRIMRAHWHLARFTMEDNAEGRRLLTEAAQMEPDSALALGDLAMIHTFDALWNWGISRNQSLAAAGEAARRAVTIDENNAWGHIALGVVEAFSGHHEEATRRLKRAISISPNDPNAHGHLGFALALSGEAEKANYQLEEAMRLSPHDPFLAFWCMSKAVAAFVDERHEETVEWCRKTIEENPRFPGAYRILAATYGELNELDKAKEALAELLSQMPGLTVAATAEQVPWKNPEHAERYLNGLRKAGLPE